MSHVTHDSSEVSQASLIQNSSGKLCILSNYVIIMTYRLVDK